MKVFNVNVDVDVNVIVNVNVNVNANANVNINVNVNVNVTLTCLPSQIIHGLFRSSLTPVIGFWRQSNPSHVATLVNGLADSC